ncbi:MAG: hypothetical protein WC916_02490 [Candidatus Woesearchaeota archaeon]
MNNNADIHTNLVDKLYEGSNEGPFSLVDRYIRKNWTSDTLLDYFCFGLKEDDESAAGYRYWVYLLEKDDQLGVVTNMVQGWPKETGMISVWYKGSKIILDILKKDLMGLYEETITQQFKDTKKTIAKEYNDRLHKAKEDLEYKINLKTES